MDRHEQDGERPRGGEAQIWTELAASGDPALTRFGFDRPIGRGVPFGRPKGR